MFIRWFAAVVVIVASLPACADDKPPEKDKADYTELARLIHAAVVPSIPKQHEDRSGWGKTIPDPGNLKVDGLRTHIKVGDKVELPHGKWVRTRFWLDDPAKDISIEVRQLRKLDAKTLRIQVAATAPVHGEREWKQWDKGLLLLSVPVEADAMVVVVLDCDVVVKLDSKSFPPEVQVEPKVVESQLELKEFTLKRVGKLPLGERAQKLGDELKGSLQESLRKQEPAVKEKANQAIAKGLKQGKGRLSPAVLLQLKPTSKAKE